MNPMRPMAPTPRKQIFIDSQSSLVPGFIASFSVLAAWDRKFLRFTMVYQHICWFNIMWVLLCVLVLIG